MYITAKQNKNHTIVCLKKIIKWTVLPMSKKKRVVVVVISSCCMFLSQTPNVRQHSMASLGQLNQSREESKLLTINFTVLGNELIHAITSQCKYELKIVMTDYQQHTKVAKYASFSVGDKSTKYALSIAGYSGDAGLSNYN